MIMCCFSILRRRNGSWRRRSETDFPALGEDIFAEFEKKKQQILNIDIGQTPDERRSKFAGLKFGNDFNLMDDDDDF